MALRIDFKLRPGDLRGRVERLFELSAGKILDLEKRWRPGRGAPVFTVKGRYTARGWTEWTQGFQYGAALLQFDATGERRFLELGRRRTIERMAPHVSHVGVHDHGFNNVSTYGTLWRLMREGKVPEDRRERETYELALKVSGAVQAARWTELADGTGYVYSFNGPHSLFVDTIRSMRSLVVADRLGHVLMGEQERRVGLLDRAIQHVLNTHRYNVYHGEKRDVYDVRGRCAHECVFNVSSGVFRSPNTQQGYSPFSTWTRGLAWALLGFAEQLEFFETVSDEDPGLMGRKRREVLAAFERSGRETADFYMANSCVDGVVAWDTGAPGLREQEGYLERVSDPWNTWEPVDSSASAIAGQGLVRLGNWFVGRGDVEQGRRYRQAGLTVARTLLEAPYLSTKMGHQGLLLHSVYHRPNGWDYVAPGQKVPNGESSMWGDYHLRELGLLILREARDESYPTFFAREHLDDSK
jgi:unsaturated chondroitin disaccharide hydrolase